MAFGIYISLFIIQRLAELVIAARNEKWLRRNGAVEYGQKHYPIIILLHTCFIVSLIIEGLLHSEGTPNVVFLTVYVLLILAKVWVIYSLGTYWNTKIFRIPGTSLIQKGPYAFLKHPNYVIVVCEFVVVPMVFHLFYTAIIFSIFNAILLRNRIMEENRILN